MNTTIIENQAADINSIEQQTVAKQADELIVDLNELQLTLVGGGSGVIMF